MPMVAQQAQRHFQMELVAALALPQQARHFASWTSLHIVSLPVALGLLHELSPLPGMFFTQVLCMTDSLSFRSLCKCHFFRDASGKPNLGFSPSHFPSILTSNCHHCIYHCQLSFQLFICFLSPPTGRQAP